MPTDEIEAIVLRDGDGGYYVLTRELLEQHRASLEEAAEIERQLAEPEVQGYSAIAPPDLTPTFVPVAFTLNVTAPRDAATGQATGRRMYLPIRITTPVGTPSPE